MITDEATAFSRGDVEEGTIWFVFKGSAGDFRCVTVGRNIKGHNVFSEN